MGPCPPPLEPGFLGASVNRAALARVQGPVASSGPNAVLLDSGLASLARRGAEESRGGPCQCARVTSAVAAQLDKGTRFPFKLGTPLPPRSGVRGPLGRQVLVSGRSA